MYAERRAFDEIAARTGDMVSHGVKDLS